MLVGVVCFLFFLVDDVFVLFISISSGLNVLLSGLMMVVFILLLVLIRFCVFFIRVLVSVCDGCFVNVWYCMDFISVINGDVWVFVSWESCLIVLLRLDVGCYCILLSMCCYVVVYLLKYWVVNCCFSFWVVCFLLLIVVVWVMFGESVLLILCDFCGLDSI